MIKEHGANKKIREFLKQKGKSMAIDNKTDLIKEIEAFSKLFMNMGKQEVK